MGFFLGYSTALACLRALKETDQVESTRSMPKAKDVPNVKLLSSAVGGLPHHIQNAILQEKPIFVAPDPESRCRSKGVESRKFGLPANQRCFFALGSNIFIASPELCFAQLAKGHSSIELMKVGFELCGTYSIDLSNRIGFRNRRPLTTKAAISKLLNSLPNNCPVAAREAARFICDGSASPMETCLALLLGLPARFGGYGLGMPQMNARVEIGERKVSSTNYGAYHCDLFWPESNVALEYNSRAFHINEKAAERDASRVNDLLDSGIKSIAVTRAHVADPAKMDIVAHALAGMMGKRMRSRYHDADKRRAELRQRLFSKDPWAQAPQ